MNQTQLLQQYYLIINISYLYIYLFILFNYYYHMTEL